MAVYAVFEPPERGDDDAAKRAERIAFVRDGFYFWALVFGPLWVLWRRLWLAFAVYVAVLAALGMAEYAGWLRQGMASALSVLIALLVALEAPTLIRRKYAWHGWRDAGIVVADGIEAAEQRFFDRRVASRNAPATPAAEARA